MVHLFDKLLGRVAVERLRRRAGVSIGDGARIDARAITFHPGFELRVGAGSIVEASIDFEREGARLVVGPNSYVGASAFKIAESVEIGRDVEIAWNCSIVDHDWEPLDLEHRRTDMRRWYTAKKDWSRVAIAPVSIGDGALVGFNAVILKGVRVGAGAVIGAGSVVTRDVEPFTVVAGSPARVIRRLRAASAASAQPMHGH